MIPAWKNSPVKASFEDRQTVQSPSDGAAGMGLQLRSDNEIYSILLSEASSTMFDDDDDHRPVAKQKQPQSSSNQNSIVNDKLKLSLAAQLPPPVLEHEQLASQEVFNGTRNSKSSLVEKDREIIIPPIPEPMNNPLLQSKESEYVHADYELLKYIDYIDDIERRFPSNSLTAAPIVPMNDLSIDALAEQVLHKVSTILLQRIFMFE